MTDKPITPAEIAALALAAHVRNVTIEEQRDPDRDLTRERFDLDPVREWYKNASAWAAEPRVPGESVEEAVRVVAKKVAGNVWLTKR